jgi:hypothetical protein
MGFKYDVEVLSSLNTRQWMTSAEIYKQISDRWSAERKPSLFIRFVGIFSSTMAYLFSEPSFGAIYNSLARLEREGMVEKRDRHGTKRLEWKLKTVGKHSPAEGSTQISGNLQIA